MSERDELLSEVRKAHRAASNKVSRLRTSKGVELNGTSYDMRRDPNRVKNYNTRQLASYLDDLKGFNHRSNGFVPGNQGTPIPAQLWKSYTGLEKRYNTLGDRHLKSIGDVVLPGSNRTIIATEADRVRRKYSDGAVSYRPYAPSSLKSENVTGVKALQKLIAQKEKQVSKDYLPKEIAEARKRTRGMLKKIKDKELNKLIRDMSDEQFNIAWNFDGLGEKLAIKYMEAKAAADFDKSKSSLTTALDGNQQIENAKQSIGEIVTAVLAARETRAQAARGRKKKKS